MRQPAVAGTRKRLTRYFHVLEVESESHYNVGVSQGDDISLRESSSMMGREEKLCFHDGYCNKLLGPKKSKKG